MNILKRLTLKSLKLNKKRTVGTIIGIILSTAMICAVATMVTSFRKTLIEEEIESGGYYHLLMQDISKDYLNKLKYNKDFSRISVVYDIGYAKVFDSQKVGTPFMRILSSSKDNLEYLKYIPTQGRIPKNDNEIAVTSFVTKFSDIKLGDTITLDVGQRMDLEGNYISDTYAYMGDDEKFVDSKSHTYKVVGVLDSRYELYAVTIGNESEKVNAYLTLSNPYDYKKSFTELFEEDDWEKIRDREIETEYNYYLNMELLRFEVFSFSEKTTMSLLFIAGVIITIIMIASIFCIRNSFAISTTEKMKMYGMLASVGATRKQIRKSVVFEGFILGLIGIPLGIMFGLLGDFILFKVVNFLVKDFINSSTVILFSVSIIPILVAILLAYVTIYLSSLSSARKASKVSPIENLKSSNEIKIKSNKLKTPKVIDKLFKTGGVIAYKNLKRSKKKYRTTVVSLTVSIFIFISISYFITAGFDITSSYYKNYDYNVVVYGYGTKITKEDLNIIKSFNGIKKTYTVYADRNVKSFDVSHDLSEYPYYECDDEENTKNCQKYIMFDVIALEDSTFKDYMKKLNVNYEANKDKAFLFDTYISYDDNKENRRYSYKNGDSITFIDSNDMEHTYSIKLTSKEVYGQEGVNSYNGYLVINKKYYDGNPNFDGLYINTDDADEISKNISDYNSDITYENYDALVREQRSLVIVISIFLYGFITLITLIGVTNIFNTITSNMELRAKEFAMLKSIGMTKKEFNRMILLETIFYSSKSLFYGTIFGLIGSYLIHKGFDKSVVKSFIPPYGAIIISIIFVFIVVYIIMRYSIKKINKQNIIETIRNENI